MKFLHRTNRQVLLSMLSTLGLVGLLMLASTPADAYTYWTCNGNKIRWNQGRADMYISTTSFPPGSSWDARLQNAMWHWNNVKGASFNFYVGRDTDGTHSSSNGKNEIYATSDTSDWNDPDFLAFTSDRLHCHWTWYSGWSYGIDETDIGFNTNYTWSTNPYSYSNTQNAPYNFEGIALHELGHALGLSPGDHENRWMATMNSNYPISGPFGYYKEWDPFGNDRQGVRFLYPDGTTEVDIAASPLKRTMPGDADLVSHTLIGYRGSYVTVEFTFSNLSTSTQTFDIGFYLSTNDYISTYDTFLGANYGAWGSAGFTGTFTRTLWIPSTTPVGTYSLGFIVDYNNAISEANETNNFQQMPRQIVIW